MRPSHQLVSSPASVALALVPAKVHHSKSEGERASRAVRSGLTKAASLRSSVSLPSARRDQRGDVPSPARTAFMAWQRRKPSVGPPPRQRDRPTSSVASTLATLLF